MSRELTGKIALVTGATRGIGAAIARRLATDGADVAFTYQNSQDRAEALGAELEALGVRAIAIQADAGDPDAAARAPFVAAEALGPLDILVHNAGVAAFVTGEEADQAEFRRQFSVNVDGVHAATRAAEPHLADGGRIIIIGSINGERAIFAGAGIYAATKHAVAGLAKGWAREFAPRGILVNVIQPGPVDTDMNPADGEIAAQMIPLLPLGRYGKPSEIAGLAAFLAGPDSSYITGTTINIDGGFSA